MSGSCIAGRNHLLDVLVGALVDNAGHGSTRGGEGNGVTIGDGRLGRG